MKSTLLKILSFFSVGFGLNWSVRIHFVKHTAGRVKTGHFLCCHFAVAFCGVPAQARALSFSSHFQETAGSLSKAIFSVLFSWEMSAEQEVLDDAP